MEVKFADTFFKSFKKLLKQETWYYKLYYFFRYNIIRFLKNIWYFRKELYNFEKWEFRFNIEFFRRTLELSENYMRNHGSELNETRLKKCDKMKRAIQILKNIEDDNYIELAEKKLGKLYQSDIKFKEIENSKLFEMVDNLTDEQQKHNIKIYNLSDKLEKDEWNEFCEIIKGQEKKDIKNFDYIKDFDGTGLKSWWD